MAKKQDSSCMFCGQVPCECDGVKKSRKPAKVKVDKAPVAPTRETDDLDFGAIPEPVQRKFKVAERDLSHEAALRVLREIVEPREQKKIDRELEHSYLPDVNKRVKEWKANHGSQSTKSSQA